MQNAQNIHNFLLAFLLMLGFTLPLPNTPQGLSTLAELGAAVSIGSTQIGEQKALQVQANLLAAVPLLKRPFGKQSSKVATKPTEPSVQPEWFNSMAAGMKFTIYDENGTAQYSQTVDVGSVSPENWGKLRQTFTAPISGLLEVEIFNYNFNFPVYFDDWHIQLTENSKPEIVQEVHYDPWGLVMQDESYFAPPSGAGGLTDGLFLFNGKELQTLADLHLYDYHWRQYDPQLGRWHSPDPADQFLGLSGYAYCGNNPVMYIDPDGRYFLLDDIAAAVVGGIVNVFSNLDKTDNIGSFFAYFGAGAVGGAASLYLGPVAGFAIGGALNVAADNLTGNLNGWDWKSFVTGGLSALSGGEAGEAFVNMEKMSSLYPWRAKLSNNFLSNKFTKLPTLAKSFIKEGAKNTLSAFASGDLDNANFAQIAGTFLLGGVVDGLSSKGWGIKGLENNERIGWKKMLNGFVTDQALEIGNAVIFNKTIEFNESWFLNNSFSMALNYAQGSLGYEHRAYQVEKQKELFNDFFHKYYNPNYYNKYKFNIQTGK